MATRDFMVHDIHGHRISNQLTKDGWETYLLAPVAGSEDGFTAVEKCESLGDAIQRAKERSAAAGTAAVPAVETAAVETAAPPTGPSATEEPAAESVTVTETAAPDPKAE